MVLFAANGATFSSWLPRVPEVRDRLDLSLGQLGAVLLFIGFGGLVSSLVAGVVVDRLGSRASAVGSTVVLGVGLVAIGWAPTAVTLALALASLSAVDAMADIAMNVQAADVQRRTDRSVMQRFHAGWSMGTVAGAAAGAVAAAAGVTLSWQLGITGAVLAVSGLAVSGSLSPSVPRAPESVGSIRRRSLFWLVAALAAALAVVEGAPGDWAAVFGSEVHGTSGAGAALGYVAVSAGMVGGRLAGDRATDRLGAGRLFTGALGLVGLGVAVVVTSPAAWVAVAGFGVVGVGVSVLFPALYLQAATIPGVAPGLGLGVMTTGARVGFLVSPLLVGAMSEATSLPVGLGCVLGGALIASALLGRRLSTTYAGGR
jgi:MFS family permease